MKDKISVIIPVYNGAATIGAAIISVLKQTYPYVELIVIDGASKDDTVKIAEVFKSKYENLIVISEKDKGVYDAMNKGVARSTGDWLYFLGADDEVYSKDTFSNVFEKHDLQNSDFVYGNIILREKRTVYDGKFSILKILKKNISHQAIFYRKTLFDKYGDYSLKYRIVSDYVYNLVLFGNNSVRKQYIDEVIAVYAEQGLSTLNRDADFKRDKNNIVKQHFTLAHYLYTAAILPFIYVIEDKLKKVLSTLQGIFKRLIGKAQAVF